jgi:DNA helicase-2/ATP-dependent DNA helicase PcrA
VGDPDQAIYGWNGADASSLTGFAARHPDAAVVRLTDNYRSSPQVLAVANAIRGRPRNGAGVLRPNAEDGPEPTVRSFPSDAEEAAAVAQAVRDAHSASVAWSHIAVLARTNAQLVLFEEALRVARVPYRVRGSSRFLDDPRVRRAVADLRHRPTALLASVLADLEDEAAREAAAGHDLATGAAPGQLHAVVRLAREHLAFDPDASADRFLRWMFDTLRSEQPDAEADAVDLATFHAAKGLEWPVVFLTGLERGLVPIGHAETGDARAEERRLLYVAVTRARRRLHCSWDERRTFGSRTMSRTPSPWLETIEAAIAAAREGPDVDWRRFIAAGREQVRGSRPPAASLRRAGELADPAVLDALKSWRRATARASGVPAHVVFHDSTLAALAEAKPRATDELLALPGLGPVKARRYGDELLAVVASADRRD